MNIIGLNETALRSLINSVSESGLGTNSYDATIHLFRDSPADDDLSSLNLNLATDSLSSNFSKLSANADGIMFGTLNLTKSAGKVRLQLSPHASSDIFSTADEIFHRGLSSRTVYDILAAASKPLGDCLIYKPNNMAAVTSTTAITMPAVLNKAQKWSSPSSVQYRECFTDKIQFGATSGYSLHIGRRHYPALSYAGAAAVVFDEPVEADFMYMDLRYTGNTYFNRSLTLEVQNEDNSFTTIGSFTGQLEMSQIYTFTKRRIRGMRLISPFASINANGYTLYYLQAFTAGLMDYVSSPLNSLVRDPFTKAVISLNLNATDRARTHRLPLITMSVGDVNSSADFKMQSVASSELTRSSFATQTLIELEA